MTAEIKPVAWTPCWRIIPSRFPPIDLFERVADPADLSAVYEIESLTNDRLRHEVGNLNLIPPEERVSGPGMSVVMAAFTHVNPQGSRFSNGTYGVFYASKTLTTAVQETRYHREAFMRYTQQPPLELDMRVYNVDLKGALHDIRPMRMTHPELYHAEDYAAAQRYALALRKEGSWGILYSSVRHDAGECVAVFRPRILSHCRQERHLSYVWNGRSIDAVIEKQMLAV
ncbi:MAG: RES family NAD+ phosphorylase [Rickettsiales bacterium]